MQQTSLQSKQWPRESLQSLQSPRHQRGTMAGKLKGTMEATTPTGHRTFKIGTHFETKRVRYQERSKKTEHVVLPSNFCWPFSNHSTPIQSHRNPRTPRGTKRLWPPLRFGPPKDQASPWQRQLSRGLPALSIIHLPYDLGNLVRNLCFGVATTRQVSSFQHGHVFKLCHAFMLGSHLSYSIHSRYLHWHQQRSAWQSFQHLCFSLSTILPMFLLWTSTLEYGDRKNLVCHISVVIQLRSGEEPSDTSLNGSLLWINNLKYIFPSLKLLTQALPGPSPPGPWVRPGGFRKDSWSGRGSPHAPWPEPTEPVGIVGHPQTHETYMNYTWIPKKISRSK